ncbi:hypothetical protein [Streptomyces venezuelae]|uniref:Uncharacterized protein n=1 Tax=Streptomyces venezuelae TaxID=54571 RepID=A0A5P2BFK8_STRVZ|nr:hypothetical protein [Streptomyces venezuelae]QES29214.1 hypothetical protein DEJ47_24765 [Streptomyces venezuelae]
MKHSDKALANGWGWVLGVSGQECRVYSQPGHAPVEDPKELLAEAAKLLGLSDPALVPARIRRLKADQKRALKSAALAWETVHSLTDAQRGERPAR